MSLVIKTEGSSESSDKSVSPHLAITHNELQGGAANKRNVALLLKSDDLTDDVKELLLKVVGEDALIEKASYSALSTKLRDAVKKFSKDRWDWVWVADFDESNVVFGNDGGMYYVEYSLQDGNVVLGDTAYPVNQIISYEETSGNIIMTEGNVNKDVRALVVKSIKSISENEKLVEFFKSKKEKDTLMEKELQELQKAQDVLKSEIEILKADLQKAAEEKQSIEQERDVLKSTLVDIEKAQAEAKQAQRQELIKSVVADEAQAEELIKSLESVEDSVFESVVKALKSKQEIVENSDLFTQVSAADQEQGEQESNLAKMLKKQFAKQ